MTGFIVACCILLAPGGSGYVVAPDGTLTVWGGGGGTSVSPDGGAAWWSGQQDPVVLPDPQADDGEQ